MSVGPPPGPAPAEGRAKDGAAPGGPPDEPPEPRPRRARAARPEPGPAPRPPRLVDRLGFRLSSLLALALLPLGLVGLVQAAAWRDAARDQAAAALMGETLRAAAPTVGLIQEARGAGRALAQSVRPLIDDPAACAAVMTAVRAASPQYSVVAYVPVSGLMTCGSDGSSFDYRPTPLFARMQADGFAPMVYVQSQGPVSGVSIVLVTTPVTDGPGGSPLGYVGLALPHAALSAPAGPPADALDSLTDPLVAGPAPDFVTFGPDGEVLTTSRGFGREGEILPEGADLARLARGGLRAFVGRTAAGEARDYAVVPMSVGSLYALGSRPALRAFALGPWAAAAPVLTTLALWGASLAVGWLAAEWLVTRHMRRLRAAIAAFAGGGRALSPLAPAGAPAEIREVETAFRRMTDTILHDEAELEDGLRQRDALLREVHHRTRNNLQLIASIMSMHARRARSAEARVLMRGVQERVMSLATVHRELYGAVDISDVRADELLGQIARQVAAARRAGAGDAAPGLRLSLAPLRLAPDQAVALALLLTEALTAAPVHPGRGDSFDLTLARAEPGRATMRLAVEALGDVPPASAPEPAGAALGDQLVEAFAAQLGGEVRRAEPGGPWWVEVGFPLVAQGA